MKVGPIEQSALLAIVVRGALGVTVLGAGEVNVARVLDGGGLAAGHGVAASERGFGGNQIVADPPMDRRVGMVAPG
jgi:hypothetical protein